MKACCFIVSVLACLGLNAVQLWPGDAMTLTRCPGGKWPGLHLDAAHGPQDWRSYTGLEVALSNRTSRAIRVEFSVKGFALQGLSPGGAIELPPAGAGTFACDLAPEPWKLDGPLELVGMRGYPHADGISKAFDLSRVSSLHVFRREGESVDDFEILSLTASEAKREQTVFKAECFLPFVDRYGQFKHLDWPGKAHSDADLAADRAREESWLKENAAGPDPDRDAYGGWASGPKRKATGFFRTEKVDGRWWFVDPEGNLFWSLGIDCLNVAEGETGIGFRERYFEELPAGDDPEFGEFYGRKTRKAAHGFYAETNRLPYATYNFAAANMLRKYGKDWRTASVDLAHRRLRAWGVNTVANWSQPEVYLARRTPYTVCLSTGGTPRRAGSRGWWGPLPDPDHPEFARVLRERARQMAKKTKDDPWCLGIFVDNELSWNDLPDLKEVAERYFATVARIVREELPNHLYLGSRIAWGTPDVYRACARHADVVSVNVYAPSFDRDLPSDCADKPLLNGEFHFGALDRGLFHAGLVATKDQRARAEAFKTYVWSCLRNPRVVGTHWFQWKDQPLTGRSDGENYQIGFLTVTDAPYPEMVAAAREVSATLYPHRAAKALRAATASSGREKVIFDTDIGADIDDQAALLYLAKEPKCELLGVTTVGGASHVRASIASAILKSAGRDDVKVYPGVSQPLVDRRDPEDGTEHLRRLEGWPHETYLPGNAAVDYLRKTIRANPGEVTIVAVGPFTNLAALFAVDPECAGLVRRVVAMGGNFSGGKPEWNARRDAYATEILVGRNRLHRVRDLTFFGNDVTRQTRMEEDEARAYFRSRPSFRILDALSGDWLKTRHNATLHDPLAAVALFHPEVCAYGYADVRVTPTGPDAGLTSVGGNVAAAPDEMRRIRVATGVDRAGFYRVFGDVTAK